MRGLIRRVFFLFILLVLLSLHYSQSFEIGYKIEPFEEGLVFDGLREKSPEGKRQKGSDEMLQFVAGGHVLGFRKGDMFIASGDHALRIEFINARPVSPANEGTCPGTGNNQQATKPLNRVSYKDLWDGVTLVYERHSSGVVKSTYTVQAADTGASSPVDWIRLCYNVPVAVDGSGNLVFSFETGRMKESRPVAWQEIEGEHIPVEVSFCSLGEREVGFKVGSYDPQFPLVIDPVLSWHTFMGSADEDTGYSIAVDTSGNVYVAGWSEATWGTPINPHSGSVDAFAVKLNSSGVRQWNTFIGSADEDYGRAIALDTSGNVYVAGWSSATWGTPVNAHAGGSFDAFAVKLNSSGVRQWSTFIGSADGDDCYGIAVDTSGNVYVAGISGATWGTPINPYAGGWEAYAAKLNSSGVRQWNTFMGSADNDECYGIAVDTSGNVYVAGRSPATWGTSVNAHAGGYDAFAAKLNSSGTLQWNTFMGSADEDYGRAIAVDTSGNVYVAGRSPATWGTPVNAHAGGYDAFAAKLNSSGVRQWNTFMGSADEDYGRAIAVDTSGNVYVAGFSYATWGTPVDAYTASTDTFAAKLNSSGVRQWNTFMGSASADYGLAIAVDTSGNVYVAGRSEANWGTPVNSYAGDQEAFAIKIADITREDFLGTWDGQGVFYRKSSDGTWIKMASPADLIAAGDLDGDGIDDLCGIWAGQGGVWVKYSSTGSWSKLSSTARDIASGDMNGDGTDDLLGTWDGQGVFYKDSDIGIWVKMASPADLIATGDLDGDGTDDLIGIWAGQGGVWVKYSSTGTWSKLSSTARDIDAGDMNGDGTDDLIGTWDGQGVYYRDSDTGTWIKMASPADLIVAGDLDGDGTDDLIGIWAGQGGVWVKYSSTGSWSKLSSTARDIDAGKMSGGAGGGGLAGFIKLLAPIGGYAEGPESILEFADFSSEGPGGWNFVFQAEENLVPKEKESMRIMKTPGPGEAGFRYIEQKNLVPQEEVMRKRGKKKEK